MRFRSLVILAALGSALALAASPRILPTASYSVTLTDCDGGVTATLATGDYLLTTKDDAVWVCYGDAGCAAGGQWYPQNFGMRQNFGAAGAATPISCRSDSATGDVSLTQIAPGT